MSENLLCPRCGYRDRVTAEFEFAPVPLMEGEKPMFNVRPKEQS